MNKKLEDAKTMKYKYFNSLNILDKIYEDKIPEFNKSICSNLLQGFNEKASLDKEYKIKFKKEDWDEYKIHDEIKKYYCCGWYELNGKRYSYIDLKKRVEEIKPYDLILEVEVVK